MARCQVVAISLKKRKEAPVKVGFVFWSWFLCLQVHFLGYHRQYDQWLGANRLRSKLIVPKAKEGMKLGVFNLDLRA